MTDMQRGLTQRRPIQNAYFYQCFGLRIRSDIAFAELDPAPEGDVDLYIRLGPELDPEEFQAAIENRRPDGSAFLGKRMDFGAVGRYDITDDTITISPVIGIRHPDLSLPLLGPVLATYLHRRGMLILHGNAVLLKDGLTVFVGDSGAGKSTTGGWFASNVGTLFTDDILPVRIAADGTPWVEPGYALVKLSSAAVEAFAPADAKILPVSFEGYPKLRVRLSRPAMPQTSTIRRICVLRRGEEAGYERLNDFAGFRAMVEHTYMAKYRDAFTSAERKALHLKQCSAVSRNVEIAILTVPSGIDRLHEVLSVLEAAE
ncbi:hypothetical protein [uncultured Croceicoccus sp.]|uniref:hypothetical protein n=1 Tax=uncultured Croceicoccus sp. TaxID=1295329 RepID=UPI002610D9A4|nr:hypothetical protein [uncultured Croceicoccus sp.]